MDDTSPSLLVRLRTRHGSADWEYFVELYTPILTAWALQAGLQQPDALDLVQDVMVTLLKKLPEFEYDPKLRFRAWLKTILMNKWRDRMRRVAVAGVAGDAGLSTAAAEDDPAAAFWQAEHQQLLMRRALQLMQAEFKEATWRACWMTVVEGVSIAETARQLNLSENAVYIARSRVLARLKTELAGLADE